jgi:hypothetical protein
MSDVFRCIPLVAGRRAKQPPLCCRQNRGDQANYFPGGQNDTFHWSILPMTDKQRICGKFSTMHERSDRASAKETTTIAGTAVAKMLIGDSSLAWVSLIDRR